MLPELKELLTYLEDNLSYENAFRIENLHKSTLNWQKISRLPVVAVYPYPEDEKFTPFPYSQVFDNPEKMLFNQLVDASYGSIYLNREIGDDLPLTIRTDYGCVLIASIFGAKVEQVEDNPPWIRHTDTKITYDQIIQNSSSDFEKGKVPDVVECFKFYLDILKDYPNISKTANIVMPDLQGPFVNLELIRGDEIFTDVYTQKDSFLEAMAKVAEIQINLAKYFGQFISEKIDGYSHQHSFLIKGGILIRDDTSIMVSPQMYREMIAPFNEQILQACGGGIHCCGNFDHIIREFLSLKSIQCFDFGQSELSDIESIYKLAEENHLPLIRINVDEDDLVSGKILNKYPTGVSLRFKAASFEQAKEVIAKYKTLGK